VARLDTHADHRLADWDVRYQVPTGQYPTRAVAVKLALTNRVRSGKACFRGFAPGKISGRSSQIEKSVPQELIPVWTITHSCLGVAAMVNLATASDNG
jgi:hypothetical protein